MFLDQVHKKYYNEFIKADNTYIGDNERKALFYLLAFNEETRNHINDIYDFQKHQIKFEGLEQGWQTSGSFAVTKLAFNLYNGFNGEYSLEGADEPRNANVTPLDIFCHFRGKELEIVFNAIEIRLGEYKIKSIWDKLDYNDYYKCYTAKSVRETGLPMVGGKDITKEEYSEKYVNIWLSKTRCNQIKKPVQENEEPVAFYRVNHGYVALFERNVDNA